MSFQLVETIELSTAASSIDFENISAVENGNLYFLCSVRAADAADIRNFSVRVNDVTSYNYNIQTDYCFTSNLYGDRFTSNAIQMQHALADNNATGFFTIAELCILDYSNSTDKKNGWGVCSAKSTTRNSQEYAFHSYNITNAFTKVSFFPSVGNWLAGSSISMYVIS